MPDLRGVLAGWLVDGSGRSPTRDQLIEIRSGRIHRIRPATGEDRGIADVLDWSGGMVVPGLIDAHVHLFMSGTPDPDVRRQQLDTSFEILKSAMDRHVHQYRRAGIVAVRDGGDYGGHALRYRDTRNGGADAAVVIRAAGRAWRTPGRYGRLIGRPAPPGRAAACRPEHTPRGRRRSRSPTRQAGRPSGCLSFSPVLECGDDETGHCKPPRGPRLGRMGRACRVSGA